jgi:glycosyltransferase involved in cell wall biosynthesis
VSEADKQALAPYCKSIDIQFLPENKRYLNLMTGLLSGMPWQVRYFYDQEIARHIDMMIDEIEPDHIYVQLIRMAPYVSGSRIPMSIDYMDAMGLNMSSVGLSQLKRVPLLSRMELKRCQAYEQKIYPQFEGHYVISHRDRKAIADRHKLDLTVVSNGVDTEYFGFNEHHQGEYDAGFVGNLGYVHNDKAAHYLIDEIMPLMSDDFRILIAGARPSKWLNIKQRRNITIASYREDVRDHYAQIKVLIAPIFSGSGQQNKILEAMAQGIPCITTSFVNQSLGAEPGVEALIADDPKRFSGELLSLKTNQELYTKLSYAGRRMVMDRFNWSAVTAPLIGGMLQ